MTRSSSAPRTGMAGLSSRTSLEDVGRAFYLFVESVRDYAIFMLDPRGHIVSWNAGAQRIKGYAPDEIIGSHFSRFYSPEDIAAGKPDRVLVEAAAEGRIEDEGWRLRKDGTPFWAHVVITAVRDADGTLLGFGKVTRDVTAMRARLEENRRLASSLQEQAQRLEEDVRARTAQLRRANADLQHANAALQTFAHSIAHDLRGPLRTIQGFAEILIADHSSQLDSEGQDLVARQARAAARLSTLVQNLLAYARVSHSSALGSLEPTSWDGAVQSALRDLETERSAAKAIVTVHGPLGLVLGHRETLTSVAHNLLSNAFKFVAPGVTPVVDVRSRAADGAVRLEICDNGVGVPAEERARIFNPFERLHPNSAYAGTGLGLAIVTEAVARMGGRLGVESPPGNGASGSCFWIELPAVRTGGASDGGSDSAR